VGARPPPSGRFFTWVNAVEPCSAGDEMQYPEIVIGPRCRGGIFTFDDCGKSEVYPGHARKYHERDLVAGQGDVHEVIVVVDHDVDGHHNFSEVWKTLWRSGPESRCAVVFGPTDTLYHSRDQGFLVEVGI